MHDFDIARGLRLSQDRSFKIGGETFTYRPAVAPEAIVRYSDMGAETPELEAIEIIDETVIALLDEGQAEKWHGVRNTNAENPLSADDIITLIRWILEAQTARPTGPSPDSSSGSGPAKNGTDSKAATASPVAVA